MSIKSNIGTLKSWLSEKVKESYEYKEQLALVDLEGNTKKIQISKWNPEIDKTDKT